MPQAVNTNTKSSHSGSYLGTYVSGASTDTNIGGAAAVIVGTIYNCTHPGHGNKNVVSGSGTVTVNSEPVATATSALSCGALLDTIDVTTVTIGA